MNAALPAAWTELMATHGEEFAALEQEMIRETATTPRELVYTRGTMRLYHYLPQTDDVYRVPMLLVMSMVSKPYIFDLSPGQSLIEFLVREGFDVYLVDWGTPRSEHSDFGVDDYVALIADSVAQVQRRSGEEDITVLGYCLGGVLTALYAALEPKGPLKNLLLLATPINGPGMELQHRLLTSQGLDPDLIVKTFGTVPASIVEGGFQVLRPLQKTSGKMSLLNNTADREFVKAHLRIVRWGADALPFPGRAFRELCHDIVIGNKIVKGEYQLRGRKLKLGDIRVPLLHVLAEHDHVVPYASSKDVVQMVGSRDKEEWVIKGGHVSLVAGVGAVTRTWPRLAAWLAPRSV